MQYSTLIAQIEADIYSNGAELITGDILQTVLKRMVSAWASAGAAYGGTISPDTVVPLSLDQATVYLALTAGTYEHFLDGEGDPIETTGPALVIYDGGPALIFTKTDLPSGGSGATVITASFGDSLVITLPNGDEGIKASYRIDMTAAVYGGDVDARYTGSLIIECNDLAMQTAHGYYYGDDMAYFLSEVAIWKDDPEIYPDEHSFYLLLTINSNLNEVIFSVSSLDGQSVDADAANEDEKVKVSDAHISPVGSGGGVFWCVYSSSGTGTTAAEIDAAVAAGLAVKCRYGNNDYDLSYHDPAGSVIYFGNIYEATSIYLMCRRSDNVWSSGILTLERTSNKVSTLSGNETNTTKYPNTKAVADALGKMGVISQTQTWTSDYGSYSLSDVTRGLIPQAFIDQWNSLCDASGSFNDTTGYFELNGLTDISYQDALDIVRRYMPLVISTEGWRPNQYNPTIMNKYKARTSIPSFMITGYTSPYLTWNIYIEVTHFLYFSNATKTFSGITAYGNYRLRRILDYYKINGNVSLPLLYALEECYVSTSGDFSAPNSKYLSLASIVYLVENATNTAAVIYTIHASAYARCQADTTEYTYQGNTYTGIIALATAKNITIASA